MKKYLARAFFALAQSNISEMIGECKIIVDKPTELGYTFIINKIVGSSDLHGRAFAV
jgi:hypothetical protein